MRKPFKLFRLPSWTPEQQARIDEQAREHAALEQRIHEKYRWLIRKGEEEYNPDR